MNSIRQFIHAEVLLILLTIVAVTTSAFPYVSIFLASMLMILYTIKSLDEEISGWWIFIQAVVSVLFCVLAGSFLVYLVFYEFQILKRKWIPVIFPAAVYGLTVPIRDVTLPFVILHTLILLGIAGLFWIGEFLTERYFTAISQTAKAVSIAAVNEMTEKKLNRELLVKNYLTEQNARLEERENISRNIHNSVGHSITAAIMTLDAADMLYDTAPEQARAKMNTANVRIRESLASIRHAVRVLDTENEYLVMEDLIQNLGAVTEQFAMDTMIRILTDWAHVDGTVVISRVHTEFLTGALQELLTNGVKHGDANRFTVVLNADSGHVQLIVVNNGKNDFAKKNIQECVRNGYGLKKIQSYVQKCGGTMAITCEPDVCVNLTLPLKEEAYNETISSIAGR